MFPLQPHQAELFVPKTATPTIYKGVKHQFISVFFVYELEFKIRSAWLVLIPGSEQIKFNMSCYLRLRRKPNASHLVSFSQFALAT